MQGMSGMSRLADAREEQDANELEKHEIYMGVVVCKRHHRKWWHMDMALRSKASS